MAQQVILDLFSFFDRPNKRGQTLDEIASTPRYRVVPFESKWQSQCQRLWIAGLNQTVAGIPITIKPVMWLMFKVEAWKSLNDGGDMKDMAQFWMRPKGSFFVAVAEDTGEVVGCIAVKAGTESNRWKPEDDRSKVCQLSRLAVSPTHRRRGIAEALCAAVGDWAKQQSMRKIQLITANKVAHRFYAKLGYNVYDSLVFKGVSVLRLELHLPDGASRVKLRDEQ